MPQITGVHVGGIRERQLSTGTDDDYLILAGEIDISNDELLTCALRAATGTASGTFRLDLSRVTFLSPPAAGHWWKAPGSSGAGAGTYCS